VAGAVVQGFQYPTRAQNSFDKTVAETVEQLETCAVAGQPGPESSREGRTAKAPDQLHSAAFPLESESPCT